MKVLFFHNTLAVYRIPWFQELAKLCHIRFVITNERVNRKNYHIDNSELAPRGLDCTFIASGLRGYIEVLRILRSMPEWEYVMMPPVDSLHEYIISIMLLAACKRASIRACYFWEKWEAPRSKQSAVKRIKNILSNTCAGTIYRHVDIVFTVGRKSKSYFLQHGVVESRLILIPDTSETPPPTGTDVRKQYHIDREKTLVLYFGRLMKEKGLDILIRAFAELPNRERYALLVAGGGNDDYQAECERMARDLGIEHDCRFAGSISPEKRADFFICCDVFVFPATYRGGCVDVWGLTINEAIQHGKPVVATEAVGSAFELIAEGENGFLVEPEDPHALASAIERASSSEMARTARVKDAELSRVYSYENMANVFYRALVSPTALHNG